MTVWFDVEDLFDYARAGHKRVSGIQRLTLEIYRAAAALGGVGFVRHAPGREVFTVLEWAHIIGEFEGQPSGPAVKSSVRPLGLPPARPPRPVVQTALADGEQPVQPEPSAVDAAPRSGVRRIARGVAGVMPAHMRGPLVLASVTQVQAVAELGIFTAGLGAHAARATGRTAHRQAGRTVRATLTRLRLPQLPELPSLKRLRGGRTRKPGVPFTTLAKPGDTLLVLGSPWFRHGYSAIARWLRDDRRMRFGVLMHDLVPVRRPEWCDDGVRRTFQAWYSDVLPVCDLVLANSRYTAGEVEAYAAELHVRLPRPVRAVPVGTGFGDAAGHRAPAERPRGDDPAPEAPWVDPMDRRGVRKPMPKPGTYVLFVSTIEARKNHALIVEVWRRLWREVRAGSRAAASVPDLVFAGRVGWLVADLVQQLDNSDWLGGRIRLVEGPSDAQLRDLYDGCLFTVFPSLHEGWGLPVTESLARGAPCLCSDAASLPEAGGALCRYFDPESVASAWAAVAAVLDDRPGLRDWRDRVRREFRPTSWTETAEAVLNEAAAAHGS